MCLLLQDNGPYFSILSDCFVILGFESGILQFKSFSGVCNELVDDRFLLRWPRALQSFHF